MTHQVKGVVENSTSKTVNTKFGPKPVYGIIVDGVEVSTGFKKEHQDGEMVNLKVEYKFGGWQKIGEPGDGLPAVGAASAPVTSSPVAKGNFSDLRNKNFPVDPRHGSMSIIRQSSMKGAIEILDTWMAEPVPLFVPQTQEEYMDMLIKVALQLTDFGSGQDIMDIIKAMEANKQVVA